MLLILAVGALAFMAYLDIIRSRILTASAITLESLLGPRVLAEMLHRYAEPGSAGNVLGCVASTRYAAFSPSRAFWRCSTRPGRRSTS